MTTTTSTIKQITTFFKAITMTATSSTRRVQSLSFLDHMNGRARVQSRSIAFDLDASGPVGPSNSDGQTVLLTSTLHQIRTLDYLPDNLAANHDEQPYMLAMPSPITSNTTSLRSVAKTACRCRNQYRYKASSRPNIT